MCRAGDRLLVKTAEEGTGREVVEWYEDIMAATVTYALDEDGVKYRYVSLNTAPKVFELHFVERAASKVGGYTVADIEGYYKEVHSATIHSPYCGFSVWMDEEGIAGGRNATGATEVRWGGVPGCYRCSGVALAHRHGFLIFRKRP